MLTEISWLTYFYAITVLLILWYCYFGCARYYKNIRNYFNQKRSLQFNLSDIADEIDSTAMDAMDYLTPKGDFEHPEIHDFEIIEELVDRVKSSIGATLQHQRPGEELIHQLKTIVKDYPSLKKSQFRDSINEFITTECELQGLPGITIHEVETIWTL